MDVKSILVSVGMIAAILSGCTTAEAPKPVSLLTPRISPAPQQAQFREFARVKVEATPVVVRCDDAAAAPWVRKMLAVWLRGYGVPDVRGAVRGAALAHGDEAYRIETKANEVVLTANTLQGIRYALYTYRQTWEASRGGVRTTHHTAPTISTSRRCGASSAGTWGSRSPTTRNLASRRSRATAPCRRSTEAKS